MTPRISVTGMGVVCSIGSSVEDMSAALRAGKSGIARRGAGDQPRPHDIEATVADFSLAAQLARLTPLDSALRDRARRCAHRAPLPLQAAVIAALQAWSQAGCERAPMDPETVGIVVANDEGMQRYHHEAFLKYQERPEYLWPRYALHGLATDPVGTISELLDIHGEGFAVAGASASGNLAIIKAAQMIELGLVQACVVIGALTDLSPAAWQAFHTIGALGGRRLRDQPAQTCRPFDQDHEGFIPGQGAGCLILESEASLQQRGQTGAAAVYLGGAMRLDGNRLANPSEDGEAGVMRQCLVRAGLTPDQVDYINAHGTSSPLGDHTEARAIQRVFGAEAARIWINSTKGLIGHCLFSAGVLEAIASIVQMQQGFVHPNANLCKPIMDGLRFCGPVAQPAEIRVALSNSFGFGGIDSAIALGRETRHDA